MEVQTQAIAKGEVRESQTWLSDPGLVYIPQEGCLGWNPEPTVDNQSYAIGFSRASFDFLINVALLLQR